MELRQYIGIARKWWWLLVLLALLGGGAAYLVSIRMEPTYQASALLMVGGGIDVINPTTGELQTSEKLAQTYAELVKTRPVIEASAAELGLNPGRFPSVTVTLVRSTQLMRITVSDTNPQLAARAADSLANQLILQSPSAPQRQEQAYRQFVEGQLRDLEVEIESLTRTVQQLRLAGDDARLLSVQSELNGRRRDYADLLGFLRSSSTNYIRVIESARVPATPVGPKVMQNTLLAAVVGLMLAGGAAFLIEYLDDSIKSDEDVEVGLELPVLGHVAEVDGSGGKAPSLLVGDDLTSSHAEAFRMLYTNLRYSLADAPRRTFMITSPGASEGKSTVAANLAIISALAGHKTILVDADMRRPRLHRLLGHKTTMGLSSLLVGEVESISRVLQATTTPNLMLLPCGTVPPSPMELLNSERMTTLLARLQDIAEVVIIDTPPMLVVADASALASRASGIIIVVEAGRTGLEAARYALDFIARVEGKVLGVVINRLDPRRHGAYYGYGYGYGYSYYRYRYSSDGDGSDGGTPPPSGLGPGPRLLGRFRAPRVLVRLLAPLLGKG